MCESIRRFAGPYADATIAAVNPRPALPISAGAERRLAELGVRYVREPLNPTGHPYLPINRIVTGRWAEERLSEPYVVLLDSDVLFTGAPEFVHADAGVRPVDVKNAASAGPGDPLDAYWSAMCAIAGIPIGALPVVSASVERVAVRASYNGGFCIARRRLGIFTETQRVFEESLRRDMRPLRGRGLDVHASTGHVGTAASEWWGSSQAALSVAIHARARDVVLYDERYNIPVHLLATRPGAPAGWPAVEPILLHYHWMSAPGHRAELLQRFDALGVRSDVRAWLRRTFAGERAA